MMAAGFAKIMKAARGMAQALALTLAAVGPDHLAQHVVHYIATA